MIAKKKQQKKKDEPTPFDHLLKRHADTYAAELFDDLGGIKDIVDWNAINGEVEIMHRLSDRAWKVKQQKGRTEREFLIHMEFQSQYETGIERRLGMYGWALYEREHLPVKSLVWYVSDQKPSGWPKGQMTRDCYHQMRIGQEVPATLRWREIWLPGKYDAEKFCKQAPVYLLPFSAMMQGIHKGLIQELHDAIMKSELGEVQKQDLLAISAFFLVRKFKIEEIKEIFKMDLMKDNPFVEYLLQTGREEGIQKGREEGREEGIQKGHRVLVDSLRTLAKQQFPRMKETTFSRLEALSLEALQDLLANLLTDKNARSFRQRIAKWESSKNS